MKKLILTILPLFVMWSADGADKVIEVPPCSGDATAVIQQAIDSVATFKGKPVTIRLAPGNYDISREHSSRHLYHISNTASAEENPDQTKHIGLWFRNLSNVTFDGNGATLVTHGEMTPLVADGCTNITLGGFTLTAADRASARGAPMPDSPILCRCRGAAAKSES